MPRDGIIFSIGALLLGAGFEDVFAQIGIAFSVAVNWPDVGRRDVNIIFSIALLLPGTDFELSSR